MNGSLGFQKCNEQSPETDDDNPLIPISCKVRSFLSRSKGELRIVFMASSLNISSTHSGNLSSSSPCFVRPNGRTAVYYYQAIQVTVFTPGMYTFSSSSSMDTFSCLYNETFFPSRSSQNLIKIDDDSNGGLQFCITLNLQPGRIYIFVVTTFSETVTGSFQVTVTGPTRLLLTPIQSTTKCSTTNDSDEHADQLDGNFGSIGFMKQTTASYVLSSSSPVFVRPYGYNYNNNVRYQAVLVTVSMTGMYTFKISSSIDTYGYLYNEPFNSSDRYRNLIIYNGDSDGSYSCDNKLTCKTDGSLDIRKIVRIICGCVASFIGVFCARLYRNKRKRTSRQQVSLLRHNQVSEANSVPSRNTGRTNEIDRPYTISISAVAVTYAEQPPPSYEVAVSSLQR
ncbi:unnamed protein product [Rotaria magnacalcarata]|uniref:Uncharacterized protein n=1 Tax=Rotaria magnacalcarata TaxID=392030 RepID=A0A818Z1V9_9BILA|nr:unnamed protein product [Rotaria magnacalcarata]